MVYTYPYNMVDGHIIVTSDDGKICLIDTGSPVSVGSGEDVLFAGRRHPLQADFLGRSIDELTEPVGIRIDALIGLDILNGCDMLIDPVRRELVVSDQELEVEGEMHSIDSSMIAPIVTAAVGGKPVRLFFDTGAKVSYMEENIANTYPPVGTAQDFYANYDAFQTVLHRVPVTLGSRCIDLDFGILPQALQACLRMTGTEGIVGTAILSHFMVAYMPRRKRIVLKGF